MERLAIEKGKNIESLRSFVHKYLLEARKYVSKYGHGEDLAGCSAPCQVNVVWFKKPTVQLLMFSHSKEKPDLIIQIHGPYYSIDAKQTFESILKSSSWVNEYIAMLPSNLQSYVRELIEDRFARTIRVIQRLIEKGEPKKAIHRSTTVLPTNAALWICEGFLPTLGVKGICDEIGLSRPTEPKEEKEEIINGWGTFFYPPIALGARHKMTFAEKITGKRLTFLDEKCYLGDCAGSKIYVGDDGFVGILCEEPAKAFHILNTVFASALVKGIETYPLQPREMQHIRFNPADQVFDIIGSPSTYGTLRTTRYRELISYADARDETRKNASRSQMRQLIRLADRLIKDNETTKLLRFFHESFIHRKNHENNSAFVLAWQVIETWILKQWILFLQNKRLTGNNIRKLADWNVDVVIQTLHISGKINRQLRDTLDQLRMKRNRIFHRGQFASEQDVESCVRLAFKFLRECIPNTRLKLPLEKKPTPRKQGIEEAAITVELADDS